MAASTRSKDGGQQRLGLFESHACRPRSKRREVCSPQGRLVQLAPPPPACVGANRLRAFPSLQRLSGNHCGGAMGANGRVGEIKIAGRGWPPPCRGEVWGGGRRGWGGGGGGALGVAALVLVEPAGQGRVVEGVLVVGALRELVPAALPQHALGQRPHLRLPAPPTAATIGQGPIPWSRKGHTPWSCRGTLRVLAGARLPPFLRSHRTAEPLSDAVALLHPARTCSMPLIRAGQPASLNVG